MKGRLMAACILLTLPIAAQAQGPASATCKYKPFPKSTWILPGEATAVSGGMVGTVCDTQLALLDLNQNGRYDDRGVDAVIIGNATAATPLSAVVNLKGELYELKVDAEGQNVECKPFTGEVGKLDLKTGFKCNGVFESLIVRDEKTKNAFNLAQAKSFAVPAGKYVIVEGIARKDKETARITKGKMQPIVVESDKTATLNWGGAVAAEFDFAHVNGAVTIEPADLKFFGRAGEEYRDFQPNAQSPKFLVYDAKTKRLVGSGRFEAC